MNLIKLNWRRDCPILFDAIHSITGDWQYDDYIQTGENYNGKRKYKSRKLAFENGVFGPMGFIELTYVRKP